MRLLLLILITGVLRAEVIELQPGDSISNAVLSTNSGDTLILNHGVYRENVRLLNHSIVIASRYLFEPDTQHISRTVIEAANSVDDSSSCIIVSLAPSDSVVICGVTLREGHGTIWHAQDRDYSAGGAIHCTNGKIAIRNCDIYSSDAEWGGGVAMIPVNPFPDHLGCQIQNTMIRDCKAQTYGGGLFLLNTQADVRLSTFDACTSGVFSGGIDVAGAQAIIEACTLRNCGAMEGAVVISGDNSIVDGCVFDGNGNQFTVQHFGTSHLVASGLVRIRNNIFRNNTTNDPAVSISDFHRFGQAFFSGNVIENHEMANRIGSVYFWNCEGDVSYNIVQNCYGERGAPFFPQGSIRFHHNVFQGNRMETTDPNYASVFNFTNAGNSPIQIDSNWIQGNSSPVISYDPFVPQPATINARYNWWGDESGPFHYDRNPDGLGDTILINNIEFEPWLTSPPDTTHSDVPDNPRRPSIPATWQILSVYPNPFNSTLRIDIAGFARDDFKIALFDLLGRECAVLHAGSTSGGSLSYPAPTMLASGIYFLIARDAHYSVANKVVFLK